MVVAPSCEKSGRRADTVPGADRHLKSFGSAIAIVLNLIFHLPAGLIILITFLAAGAISLVVLDDLGSWSWGEHAHRRHR